VITIRANLGPGRFQLDVDGHDQPGSGGAVCAAVSAITQTALLGLEQMAGQHPSDITITITEE
jgi:uncharacterized protein YsxB (DUF464 family)